MNVIISLFNVALLAGLAFLAWRKSEILKSVFWPALLLKLLSGILLGLLYTHYYTIGDTFGFFQDGVILSKLARDDFFTYLQFLWSGDESFSSWSQLTFQQPRSLFLSKLVSIFNVLTFDNYWITSLHFSFLSFAAAWSLVKLIVKYFPDLRLAAVIAFLFFPSVVFWGSGIIKESLSMASLYFLSAIFLKIWEKERVRLVEWILVVASVWILWNLKYYYAGVFIPVVVTCYVVHRVIIPVLKPRTDLAESALWLGVFLLLLFLASFIHPNFYPKHFFEVIVTNCNAFREISRPEDMILFNTLEASGISVLLNSPWALFSGLFRPFLWEAGNLFQFMVAMENLLLVALFITSIPRIKNVLTSPHRLLILSLIVFIAMLCVFITLSTPNFGTLSRYRVGYIPYFVFLLMIDNPTVEKIVQRFTGRLVR